MLVFTVDKEGKAQMQPIVAGAWDGDNWIINSGLKAGDVVIVEGVNKVLPGSTVKIIPPGDKEKKPTDNNKSKKTKGKHKISGDEKAKV